MTSTPSYARIDRCVNNQQLPSGSQHDLSDAEPSNNSTPPRITCLNATRRPSRKKTGKATRRSQVTIHEIADEAGVSIATVSRALNTPEKVRQQTRERVLAVIRKRNYVSDALAVSLVSRRSGTIGVIIPTIVYSIYAGFIHSIQKACGEAGYTVLTGITEYSGALEDEIVTRLLERRVDGLILTGVSRDPSVYGKIRNLDVPFVASWHVSQDPSVASISFDNYAASLDAMNHLYGLGHRRIGLICGKSALNDRAFERRRAYTDFLRDKQMEFRESLVEERDFEFSEGESAMKRILHCRTRPTAVFCANDILAVGAMHACRDQGINVPSDLSIMGFDNHPVAEHVTPPLSTIRVPAEEMGREATRTLLRAIADGESPTSSILPTETVIRSSTAPLRPIRRKKATAV